MNESTRRPFTPSEVDTVRLRAEAGKTDPEIGAELGRHPKSVQKLRLRLGVVSKNNLVTRWMMADLKQLEDMFFMGALDQEIASKMGRSLESIRCKRQALGLDGSFKSPARRQQTYTRNDIRRLPPCSPEASYEERALANAAYLLAAIRAGHPVYFNARGPE